MRALLIGLMALGLLISSRAQAQTGVVVDALLTEVQQTLVRVRDEGDDADLPPLSKITLNLKNELKRGAGGRLSLYVVELGSSVAEESVQEISLVLEPPRDSDRSPVSETGDLLADAIIQSARAVKRAADGTPPLHLKTLTAKVRFVVSADASAGVGFTLLPIGIDLGGEVKTVAVQEVVVEFGS